jgi:O-methyltransferase
MTTFATRVSRKIAVLIPRGSYRSLKSFTMIHPADFATNLELAKRFSAVRGAVVECGTWRGGMIAGIAAVLGNSRDYHLFDSFEGLPPAREIDGAAALQWQANADAPTYYDNCTASEEDARAAMQTVGATRAHFHKGWFQDTLPRATFPDGIAILRLDADWYDSTIVVLDHLFDSVAPGGLILIDDYYTWDGCSRAVHDFLSKRQRPERIHEHRGICYITKLG